MTTQDDIRRWLQEGKRRGATHVIVACDTFDWGDYPIYVLPGEKAADKAEAHHHKNMQKVMECYDLSLDWEAQLNEPRSYHGWSPNALAS